MNTNLLAISNIFTGTGSAGPAALKSTAVKQSRQFSPSTLDNRPLTDSRGTETAENTFINPQNGIQNVTPSEFNPALGAKAPQKGENSKNATKQI